MPKYICPFQVRTDTHPFLMCKDLMRGKKDYTKKETALMAMCAFQAKCACSGRMENTDGAEKCYQFRSGHSP